MKFDKHLIGSLCVYACMFVLGMAVARLVHNHKAKVEVFTASGLVAPDHNKFVAFLKHRAEIAK